MRAVGRGVAAFLALIALIALGAAATAQTPTPDPGQATLDLSAVLNGASAPLTGGLKWRVFAAQGRPRRLLSADRRIQSRPADAHPSLRRICRACRPRAGERRQARDARRGGPRGTVDAVGRRVADRGHRRRRADRPLQALARDLRAAEPQPPGQARLRQSEGRRSDRLAGRRLPYRFDLPRHRRPLFRGERAREFGQVGRSGAAGGDSHQLDRQRRHQGGRLAN